ncbi:MAG: prephenate dehydrogenase [Eubacteriales bacterium]|jgi:prephenate dehydrogenase|nr:prephenate dehydrogenase [Eubacteriales bacterium]
MRIGIVGLGLIGGSLATAINSLEDYTVYGYDASDSTTKKAILVGAIDGVLSDSILPACDMIIVALWPKATVEYIQEHADKFGKNTLVVDCSGVKQYVTDRVFPLAEAHGFTFIGAHPMAGMAHAGFSYAKKTLFDRASMVLVPPKDITIEDMAKIKKVATDIGFTNFMITTPQNHDRMIAFTSQLAHVVSNAYIKSPTALEHEGFSAGSYRDLTRVAKLNEDMWTELFLENPDNLADEIDRLIEQLAAYSRAIRAGDADTLHDLLKEGRERKEQIDKERF